ncbi:MAG: helix-turn-helix domain-containing protein [Bacilli bacterium]|nr:helix-turn-helix domain-containing protein [Bacilli bacterium]
MNIGERLLELRKQKGFSQEEVADQVGVTRQTVSKWEVGESKPDFDKIIPLCDLFSVTTEELLRGENSQEEKPIGNQEIYDRRKVRIKTARVLSISIFLYFVSISWIVLASSFESMSDELMVSIFLLICAIATSMIVYHFVSIPKEKKGQLGKQNPNRRLDGIIAMIFAAIYLYISFITGAWYITWLLWIVYSIVIEIIHLILEMKGENKNGKE